MSHLQLGGPKLRHRWVLPLLIVLLVTIPILEVWLLIQVGQQIGVLYTVLILVGEALLGAWLMRSQGTKAWQALNAAIGTQRMPTDELVDGALVLVGGVLLMLPGFATDVIGFFFLLPFTRPLARRLLAFVVARRIASLGLPVVALRPRGDVVEGEVVESPPSQRPGRDQEVIAGEVDDGRSSRDPV